MERYMNRIKDEIEHLVDCFGIKGSADLKEEQRSHLVSCFVENQSSEDLLETLVERDVPDDLPVLVSSLYTAKSDAELLYIARKLNTLSKSILDHHYDDKIDDDISDYRWDKRECDGF